MDNFGLVSIITPSYNSSSFIAETIESILSQTYLNWELLITDDCSTDRSVEIIERYIQRDSRIKLFRLEKNCGAGVCRNRSISECGYWHAAANRMYYACYYMTTALLIKNGFQASTHSGVIRLLGLHFVSTGIISKDLGRFYSKLFELRQSGDYDDWIVIDANEILPLMDSVDNYLNTLLSLIEGKA